MLDPAAEGGLNALHGVAAPPIIRERVVAADIRTAPGTSSIAEHSFEHAGRARNGA